ncbi:MAG TPA: hypothetical protein VF070_28110 [Streptosporangiaceae bacterium]
MSWTARCLRLAERITWRACRCLPASERGEWYQVWVAELPAFLDDADGGPLPLRVAKMLWCAGDHHRAARRIAAITRPRRRFSVPSPSALALDVAGVVLRVLTFFGAMALMVAGSVSQDAMSYEVGSFTSCSEYICSQPIPVPKDPARSHHEGHIAWLIAQSALLALLIIGVGWLLLCVFRSRRRRVAAPQGDG